MIKLKTIRAAWLVPAAFSAILVVACDTNGERPTADEPARSAEARSGTLSMDDGATLYFESHGQGDTAVVMVHCWGCNRAFWRHQIGPLVEAGYRVVTVDLPGHGQAGAEREDWQVETYAGDIRLLVDELDLDDVVLVGHSMGGPVSVFTAPLLGERVAGIVCVDTLQDAEFEWPDGWIDQILAGMEEDFAGGIEAFIGQLFKDDADPELVRWVVDQAQAADRSALVELMADFSRLDMRTALGNVHVPVRCINAEVENGQGIPTRIETNRRYADFDAVLMGGVGHYPQLEAPDEFNAQLLEVVGRLVDSGN